MSLQERFELLVSELGPALELAQPTPNDTPEETAYALRIDDEDEVELRLLDEKESLLISIALGETASVAHYRALLSYNALHETTGGVRLGLDDSTNQVVLSFETPLDELTIERLRDYLLNLAGIAGLWREAIAGDVVSNQLPQQVKEPSGVLRV